MSEKVSIIIPVYNVEKYLDECVNSVIKQTYDNLEIILVDDGSPDNCPSKCDEWEQKDNRIKVIHKENGGLSDARNAGMKLMTGDYVLFVDSDDYLALDMIEKMIEKAKEYNCDITMCNIVEFNKINEIRKLDDGSIQEYKNSEIIENYLYHRDNFCSGIWNKLIKRDIIKDLEFPKGVNSEDYYMYSFIYLRAKRMIKYNKCLYHYRVRKGSICRSGINEQTFTKIKVAKLVKENLIKQGYTNNKAINHFCMQAYHDVLYYLLRDGGESDLIRKHKKLLRKFYWETITDSNNSMVLKAKMTMLCVAPVTYTKIKNIIKKDPYSNSREEEWFE